MLRTTRLTLLETPTLRKYITMTSSAAVCNCCARRRPHRFVLDHLLNRRLLAGLGQLLDLCPILGGRLDFDHECVVPAPVRDSNSKPCVLLIVVPLRGVHFCPLSLLAWAVIPSFPVWGH
jgi:hypothetical protein